ncbi:iron-sulfur cluster biosynthesis family protein [Paenibacillus hexagrammi]|uniref:Core domain-containing protein n=1 Tax=Paenibacillus hexagrammi TaxID=2908839 RepID=A0ABY3SPW8_9BACL|nr:iron-sulfur cluster biosynthesis family protein [Paenibacillus sp. YPD9-1]UJF36029.1 hypothetical protein L0M14_13700 [Paenibacillus sp. YPD9-1]
MKVIFTEAAIDKLTPVLQHGSMLRLVFDTEGCGCSVNGVPTLWIVAEPSSGDTAIEAEPFQMSIHTKDEIYFEELMKIDYQPEKNPIY